MRTKQKNSNCENTEDRCICAGYAGYTTTPTPPTMWVIILFTSECRRWRSAARESDNYTAAKLTHKSESKIKNHQQERAKHQLLRLCGEKIVL